MSILRYIFCILSLTLVLFSCERQPEQTQDHSEDQNTINQAPVQPPTPEVPLLSGTQPADLVELPSDALPIWRRSATVKPTLVLFSSDPLLQPIPQQLAPEVRRLTTASVEELARFGPTTPETLLYPDQALSAALDAGFFSEVVWVVPLPDAESKLAVEPTQNRLFEIGVITDEESRTLESSGNVLAGTFRGVPFTLASIFHLPKLEGPVVLHIDLSYFRDLYQSEIKKPIFQILFETLSALRQQAWPTTTVSISLNNLSGNIGLDARFFGPVLAEIFRTPSLLDDELPPHWAKRGEALFLDNFFQPDKIDSIYNGLAEQFPRDASIQFALYRNFLELDNPVAAFKHLDKAVTLDRAYALEYLSIADRFQDNNPLSAIEFTAKALDAFPDNPFIALTLAERYVKNNKPRLALDLLTTLKQENWSPFYYARMPDRLAELTQVAENKLAP